MCSFVRNDDGVEVKTADCGKCNCGASSSSGNHSKTKVGSVDVTDKDGNVVDSMPVYGCGSCGTYM